MTTTVHETGADSSRINSLARFTYSSRQDLRDNQRIAAQKQMEILKMKLNPTQQQYNNNGEIAVNNIPILDTNIQISKKQKKPKRNHKISNHSNGKQNNDLLILKKDGYYDESKKNKFEYSRKGMNQDQLQLGELPSCSNQSNSQSVSVAPKERSKYGFFRRLFRAW